jgi:hypothetical protein
MSAVSQPKPAKPSKIADAKLEEILPYCKMPPEAKALIEAAPDAQGVINVLAKNGYLLEATRVYAQALPNRESVWWACMCAYHTAPDDMDPNERKPRDLAETWVRSQKDEDRRAAMEAAKARDMKGPEAWCASAAFYSGDSIAPIKYPPNKPAPHLSGMVVAAAVLLASLRGDASRQPDRLARFLESAQDISGGGSGRLPVEKP